MLESFFESLLETCCRTCRRRELMERRANEEGSAEKAELLRPTPPASPPILSYLPSPSVSERPPPTSTSTTSESRSSPTPQTASTPSGPEDDVQKLKARLFFHLLCAFAVGSVFYVLLCLFVDRTLATFPALMAIGSAIVYSSLLLFLFVGRGRTLRTIALVACIYHHAALLVRCAVAGVGVRSECFVWLQQLPVLVFFMLGRKAGIIATVLVILEGLLLLLFEGALVNHTISLDCVTVKPELNVVVISSECSAHNMTGLHVSRLDDSPLEIWMNRTFALLFFSGFAYAYEELRTFAMTRMEQILKEKEASNISLRKATEAKTQFMSNMSHELRTPLHGIIAMTRELLGMPLCEKARESAKIVSDCADHLLGLVNDILDFARIEAQKFELEAIPFCVVDEIKKSVNLHTPLAAHRGVKLIAGEPQLEHPYRIGDPQRLRQVLVNLLSNAIKFTPEGGTVTLHVRDSAVNREEISVRVEDTGIGIPEPFMSHLFDSFSQLDTSVRRRHGGPGLGLAICKKLCEAMGGKIWCDSQVGRGSMFYFTVYLPTYSPSPRSSSPVAGRMEEQSKGTRVLVVEDNPINQKVATKMLTSLGCSVKVAGDGAEGVDLFEREAFDVILMDVQMPVMDGFQATARIRQIEQQRRRNSLPAPGGGDATPTNNEQHESEGEEEEETEMREKREGKEEEERQEKSEADDEEETEEEVKEEKEKEETVGGEEEEKKVVKEYQHQQQQQQRKEQAQEIPIVALTASATRDYEEKCLEQGMTCFLTKPLRRETLLATLSSVCGKGRPRERNNSV